MKIIDLYSGAGGMTLGFHKFFNGDVQAVEMDKDAAESWRLNFGNQIIQKKVSDCIDIFDHADIVVGGPPCQGFSRRNPKNYNPDLESEQNKEWVNFLKVVKKTNPVAFVMENVPLLKNTCIPSKIYLESKKMGYLVNCESLKASDFGCPTKRVRFFIVGIKNKKWIPPKPTYTRKVKDVISDLPEPKIKGEEDISLHFFVESKNSREKMQMIPKNVKNRIEWLKQNHPNLAPKAHIGKSKKYFPGAYGKISWDDFAPTITTHFINPSSGKFGHPEGHRMITLREGARLQTFPDDFLFSGSNKKIAKQIGNAVPPLLSEAVARSLAVSMFSQDIDLDIVSL